MGKLVDIIGQRFGRLTVIARQGRDNHYQATWLCLCDCGKECVCRGHDLRRGRTKSCGCLCIDDAKIRFITHGKRRTRLYEVWYGMKMRCYNPKNSHYHRYGGRGITVCDEWLNDFQAFYNWAMANGYNENAPYGQCTIDRIDNNKGYSPDNCRWVDMKVQRQNQEKCHKDQRR